MIRLILLAGRNFWRSLNRYRILILSIAIAVAAMVVVIGALQGLTRAVEIKASRYFSGDVVVQVQTGQWRPPIPHPEIVEGIISELPIPTVAYARRSVYFDNNPRLFFNGIYARQRRLMGVEWELEHPALNQLSIIEGTVPQDDDAEGIVISSATAQRLGARVGDQVTIVTDTARGQANTALLVVRAIFEESSFFGYSAYLERAALNRIIDLPESRVNEFGIYLQSSASIGRAIRLIDRRLAEAGLQSAVVSNRDQRVEVKSGLDGTAAVYTILGLDAQLAEIRDLVDALTLVAAVIVILFLSIVVIGVSNSYSMIVFERTREIGTLRAVGLTREKTIFLFLFEAAFLGVTSILLGFFSGVAILSAVGYLADFSFAGIASLFLVSGRLQWFLPPGWMFGIFLVALSASIFGALKPALAAARLEPVEALRQE
jgi:putative ABC transport system permease protein